MLTFYQFLGEVLEHPSDRLPQTTYPMDSYGHRRLHPRPHDLRLVDRPRLLNPPSQFTHAVGQPRKSRTISLLAHTS